MIDIEFDAFVRPGHGRLTEIVAHPHGLAQCQELTRRTGLREVPAASNAAACRDVADHQVALGPPLCGELYGLETFERGVNDYRGARTRFLTIAPRAGRGAPSPGTRRPTWVAGGARCSRSRRWSRGRACSRASPPPSRSRA
nr:prephenate dehydratase domain-containing protein [Paraoerskovia sediminicola]